jgi:hypothetical protein
MESLQIIILQESNKLAKSHEIIQDYDFFLPLGNVILLTDLIVKVNDVTGQLILDVAECLVVSTDHIEVSAVLGVILINNLNYLIIVIREFIVVIILCAYLF